MRLCCPNCGVMLAYDIRRFHDGKRRKLIAAHGRTIHASLPYIAHVWPRVRPLEAA